MGTNNIGITDSTLNWNFQQSHIERHMDNAAYEAAHPDDTLVLAGPPRKSSIGNESGGANGTGIGKLWPIGMLQSVSFSSSKPTQPMMAIGSGRSFYVSGKSQSQFNIARLFINGRNLLRALYANAVGSGLDVSKFDDPAALAPGGAGLASQHFINLDSELFYIPFGMAVLFRNKSHAWVGAFYAELLMINSFAVGFNAGQNMIMENVSGVCDRLLPLSLIELANNPAIPKSTLDLILGLDANSDGGGGVTGQISI